MPPIPTDPPRGLPMQKTYILALDQGTTSSRALLFNQQGRVVARAQQELTQIYPAPGEVEHDPEQIWATQLATAQAALKQANVASTNIAAIGITNQRETTILWEKSTGRPIANAIVWQSRVTAPRCSELKAIGLEPLVRDKTGLVIDAYFSATKIQHLLDTIPGARAKAERGEVLFGTVDTFLIWRMTAGHRHVTDVSNASRTMLMDLRTLEWDDELLRVLNIPRAMLPRIISSSENIGATDASIFGGPIPIAGVAGDQQAATFGQACFTPGSAKNTYGTGCFMLLNTGATPVRSAHHLLTTVGWRIGREVVYCLEGSIFIGGAVVQWLRDGLKLIEHSRDVERLAATVPDSGGVYFVPAFVGLGAPTWDSQARGLIIGLTRDTQAGHIARAAVESMAFQTRDVLDAMQRDSGRRLKFLRVDGGAALNDALMQFQADVLDVPVRRPVVAETTALGAAYLAGLAVGYWHSPSDIEANWALDREFTPHLSALERDRRYAQWESALKRAQHWLPG